MAKSQKNRAPFNFSSWMKWIILVIILLALPLIVFVALNATRLAQHADTAQGPANDLKLTNQSRDQYLAAQNLISQLNTYCYWTTTEQLAYTAAGVISNIQVKPSFVPNPSRCEQVADQIYKYLSNNSSDNAAAQQLQMVRTDLKSLMGNINPSVYPVDILYTNVNNLGLDALTIKELVGKYSATYPCMLSGAILAGEAAGGTIICPTIPPSSTNSLISDLLSFSHSFNDLLAVASSDYNFTLYNTLASNISLLTPKVPTPTLSFKTSGNCALPDGTPDVRRHYTCVYSTSEGLDGGVGTTGFNQSGCRYLCKLGPQIHIQTPNCKSEGNSCLSPRQCHGYGGKPVSGICQAGDVCCTF